MMASVEISCTIVRDRCEYKEKKLHEEVEHIAAIRDEYVADKIARMRRWPFRRSQTQAVRLAVDAWERDLSNFRLRSRELDIFDRDLVRVGTLKAMAYNAADDVMRIDDKDARFLELQ